MASNGLENSIQGYAFYLKNVLGISTTFSPHPNDTRESRLTEPAHGLKGVVWFRSSRPCFRVLLSSQYVSNLNDARGAELSELIDYLGSSDADLLTKIITAAGFTAAQVEICLVADDIDEGSVFQLLKGLAEQPLRTILFGVGLSRQFLGPQFEMSRGHGYEIERDTILITPTYGLYDMNGNAGLKRDVWADLKKFILKIGAV